MIKNNYILFKWKINSDISGQKIFDKQNGNYTESPLCECYVSCHRPTRDTEHTVRSDVLQTMLSETFTRTGLQKCVSVAFPQAFPSVLRTFVFEVFRAFACICFRTRFVIILARFFSPSCHELYVFCFIFFYYFHTESRGPEKRSNEWYSCWLKKKNFSLPLECISNALKVGDNTVHGAGGPYPLSVLAFCRARVCVRRVCSKSVQEYEKFCAKLCRKLKQNRTAAEETKKGKEIIHHYVSSHRLECWDRIKRERKMEENKTR